MGLGWDRPGDDGMGAGLVESFSKSSLLSSVLFGWATPGCSPYAGLRVRR